MEKMRRLICPQCDKRGADFYAGRRGEDYIKCRYCQWAVFLWTTGDVDASARAEVVDVNTPRDLRLALGLSTPIKVLRWVSGRYWQSDQTTFEESWGVLVGITADEEDSRDEEDGDGDEAED